MTNQHPLTPPQWQVDAWHKQVMAMGADVDAILLEIFRAGADAARRPKPPSLAEEALKALNEAVYMADDNPPEGITTDQANTICRALKRLQELEGKADDDDT